MSRLNLIKHFLLNGRDNAIEACKCLDLDVDSLIDLDHGEDVDPDDVEDECLAELQRNYNIIMLDDYSVIVQN